MASVLGIDNLYFGDQLIREGDTGTLISPEYQGEATFISVNIWQGEILGSYRSDLPERLRNCDEVHVIMLENSQDQFCVYASSEDLARGGAVRFNWTRQPEAPVH